MPVSGFQGPGSNLREHEEEEEATLTLKEPQTKLWGSPQQTVLQCGKSRRQSSGGAPNKLVFQCGGRYGVDAPRPGLCAGTGVINRYIFLETAFSQGPEYSVPQL